METIRKYWDNWRLGYWLAGIGSALFVIAALFLLSAYLLPSSWGGVRSVRDMLPLPMATVSGTPVATYADVAENLAALRRFYESQDFSSVGLRVDFSTPEGKERLRIRELEILNKMIEDAEIRKLAWERGISFTERDALGKVLEKAREADGETSARGKVASLYGWDLERFASEIVLPELYRDALEGEVMKDRERFRDASERIHAAERMLSDGRSFSDVSAEMSEGRTAEDDGSMGWFAYDQLTPALREFAKTQEIGVYGPVIESNLGFHILRVNARQTKGDEELVDLSQIFVGKETFGEWLTGELRKTDVRILAPEYEWDEETATVEFRDGAMRDRKRKILEQSEGDASVMF